MCIYGLRKQLHIQITPEIYTIVYSRNANPFQKVTKIYPQLKNSADMQIIWQAVFAFNPYLHISANICRYLQLNYRCLQFLQLSVILLQISKIKHYG